MPLPQKMYAFPSSSIKTLGSRFAFSLLETGSTSCVTKGSPIASSNGPIGEVDTATPIAFPFLKAWDTETNQ